MGSMFKSPKAPPPINVAAVAGQQNEQNLNNAHLNASFNRINQTDPFGNFLRYSQTGTDERGNPIFSMEQGFGEGGQQFAQGLMGLGGQYLDRAGQMLGNPADFSNQATEQRLFDLGRRRLDPMFNERQAQLDNQLRNQGLDPTSEAYKSQMGQFDQGRNDAYNQLLLSGRGQAFGEALQGRNQQLGEMMQLPNGVNQLANMFLTPRFGNAPNVNVGNVDIAGLNMANQQQQMQQYQQQMQQRNAMFGGLAGLGGAILGAPMTGGGSVGGYLMGQMF